jgi:hypothetical protein
MVKRLPSRLVEEGAVDRLNQDPPYDPNYLLASLGTNLRTTCICREEGLSLREKREGWGPLAVLMMAK